MAWRDYIYFIRCKFVQVLFDCASKGHHDFSKIALGRFINTPFINNEKIGTGNMGTKKITAEQNLVFMSNLLFVVIQ